MDLPKRKQNRLAEYDYSSPNAYFITICTQDRMNLFWKHVGAAIGRPYPLPLSHLGEIVEASIKQIPSCYPAVSVDNYVVMPNHIHLLLQIHSDCSGRPMAAPTISTIINQMKGNATKQAGFSFWQKGYYDHVVRGEWDYKEIWEYIDNNPIRWNEDKLYM